MVASPPPDSTVACAHCHSTNVMATSETPFDIVHFCFSCGQHFTLSRPASGAMVPLDADKTAKKRKR